DEHVTGHDDGRRSGSARAHDSRERPDRRADVEQDQSGRRAAAGRRRRRDFGAAAPEEQAEPDASARKDQRGDGEARPPRDPGPSPPVPAGPREPTAPTLRHRYRPTFSM